MLTKNEPLLKYETRDGLIVSESKEHRSSNGTLFIVESGNRFHSINSTKELIKELHPPKARIHSPRLNGHHY